jgi:hypothetical protein
MEFFMRIALAVLALAASLGAISAPAAAGDRMTIGWGRLFTNDAIGDGRDRWRTGSYAVSLVRGPAWEGQLPGHMGEILEYRFRSEIIAPANLVTPAPGDRRYAGVLSFGVHTHFMMGPMETSLGLDLVATGKMTGIGGAQRQIHELFGLPEPTVLGDQIGNGVHPTVTLESGHTFVLSDRARLRPFVEAKAGDETLVRLGADALFGPAAQSSLMLRDVSTGQRYRATIAGIEGTSFAVGGDVAHVFSSIYLPADQGYAPTDLRVRLRAGLHWQRGASALFYGVTWLGEEFEGQPGGQLVGSLRLKILF